MSTLRVLSLLPVVGHPRDSKRIDMLLAAGLSVRAAAFSRSHPVSRAPRCPVEDLGHVEDGMYLKRIISALGALFKVIKCARRSDIIYASGQDMALIGLAASLVARIPVVMEVGDLRGIQFDRGVKGFAVRLLDRYIATHVKFLVVTSELFVSEYYRPLVGRDISYIVLENKLDFEFVDAVESVRDCRPNHADISSETITIGYFGVLRFQWPLDALCEILRNGQNRYRLVLAGYQSGNIDLEPLLAMTDQVEYIPSYKSPDDLPKLYNSVDITWCAYPVSGDGHSGKDWVRANRFYEACLFKKPLVVLSGTGDSESVRSLEIGLVLKSQNIAEVAEALSDVDRGDLLTWQENLYKLPLSTYAYTHEQGALAEMLHRAAFPINPEILECRPDVNEGGPGAGSIPMLHSRKRGN